MAVDPSIVISAIALLVSAFSAWVSYQAYRRSLSTNERMARLSFARERSEFLVRIEASRKRFEQAQQRIVRILEQIESQASSLRASLVEEEEQLRSDETFLKGCIRQALSLWDEVYEMTQDGLAHHRPRHLALLEDDDEFTLKALARADEAEAAIAQAQFIARPIGG